MRRLYRMFFGPPCKKVDTESAVHEAKEKVRQALRDLDQEVLTLMTEALRDSASEGRR